MPVTVRYVYGCDYCGVSGQETDLKLPAPWCGLAIANSDGTAPATTAFFCSLEHKARWLHVKAESIDVVSLRR